MNILVVGCSWSAGIDAQPYNWVEHLSKVYTNHNWYNFSITANSVEHQILTYNQALEQFDIDYTIFQITNPARLTLYSCEFDLKEHVKQKNNYFYIEKPYGKIYTITPASLHVFKGEIYKKGVEFFRDYVEMPDKKIEAVKELEPNLIFSHSYPYRDIVSIKEILGEESFSKYCIDDGFHFSRQGAIHTAKVIEEMIKKDLTTLDKESII